MLNVPVSMFMTYNNELVIIGNGETKLYPLPIKPFKISETKNPIDAEEVHLLGSDSSTYLIKVEYDRIPTTFNERTRQSLPSIDYIQELVKEHPEIIKTYFKDSEPYPMFLDIETDSTEDHFSKADRDEILSIQIKFPDSDPIILIQDDDTTEVDILLQFQELCIKSPTNRTPDLVVGYYLNRFDIPFIHKRLQKNKLKDRFMEVTSRIKLAGSKAKGMYTPYWIRPIKKAKEIVELCPGLVSLDLYFNTRDDLALKYLPNRKMKTVAEFFKCPALYNIDDDQKGRMGELLAENREKFIKYSISDILITEFIYDIYIPFIMANSNLLSAPMSSIHRMTSGQKSYIYLYREMRKNKYFSFVSNGERYPNLFGLDVKFQGALVACYQTGYFQKIIYLDAKCIHPDTEVITKQGYKKISEVNINEPILNDKGWCTILHKENSIKTNIIDIRTRSGSTITINEDHVFPIWNKQSKGFKGKINIIEKKASDLNINDILIECYNYNLDSDSPDVSDTDKLKAELLGILDAEGYINRSTRNRIRYDRNNQIQKNIKYSQVSFTIHVNEIEFKNRIVYIMSFFFPNDRGNIFKSKDSLALTIQYGSHHVYDEIIKLQNWKNNISSNKFLSSCYLKGLFTGDGTYNKKRQSISITQSLKNEKILLFARTCLIKCGIYNRITPIIDIKLNNKIYKKRMIEIPTSFVGIYMKQIGFIGYKGKNIPNIVLNKTYSKHKFRKNYYLTRIASINKRKEKTNMIDIMVSSINHPYFFANNILTHNSMYPTIMHDFNLGPDRCKFIEMVPYPQWDELKILKATKEKEIVRIQIPDDNYNSMLIYEIDVINDGFIRAMINDLAAVRSGYKKTAKEYEKKFKISKDENDRKQMIINDSFQSATKILINSQYGLHGNKYYEIADLPIAIFITAIGRWIMEQMLELFGDSVIEVDSVTGNTPVYVKDKNNIIDIIPIEDLHNSENKREMYNGSNKIWTRNKWKNIEYTKKHKVNKPIHRIKCSDAMVDCTSDHSLFEADSLKEISPINIIERNSRIEITKKPTINNHNIVINEFPLNEELAWLYGLFLAEGSYSESIGLQHKSTKWIRHSRNMSISINDKKVIKKAQYICNKYLTIVCGSDRGPGNINFYDTRKSSSTYRITGFGSKKAMNFFRKYFYTLNKDHKKIPYPILNCNNFDILKSFIEGYELSDGYNANTKDKSTGTIRKTRSSDSVDKCLSAGIRFILHRLGLYTTLTIRKDKQNIVTTKVRFPYSNGTYRNIDKNIVSKNYVINNHDGYVYDISTSDGTFVSALGEIVLHNTDGLLLDRTKLPTDDIDYINNYLRNTMSLMFGLERKKINFELEFEGAGSVYVYKKKSYVFLPDENKTEKGLLVKGSAFTGYGKAPVIKRAVTIMSQSIMGVGQYKDLSYNEAENLAFDIEELDSSWFKYSATLKKEPSDYSAYQNLKIYMNDLSNAKGKTKLTKTKDRMKKWLKINDIKAKIYNADIGIASTMEELDIVANSILEGENYTKNQSSTFMLDIILAKLGKGEKIEIDDSIEYYLTTTANRYTISGEFTGNDMLDYNRYKKDIARVIERFRFADDVQQDMCIF